MYSLDEVLDVRFSADDAAEFALDSRARDVEFQRSQGQLTEIVVTAYVASSNGARSLELPLDSDLSSDEVSNIVDALVNAGYSVQLRTSDEMFGYGDPMIHVTW